MQKLAHLKSYDIQVTYGDVWLFISIAVSAQLAVLFAAKPLI